MKKDHCTKELARDVPIALTPFNDEPVCFGYTWTITDRALLAKYVAQVVLGQYRHVAQIIAQQSPPTPSAAALALETAKKKLALTGKNNQERLHRDGWVFQIISWIAVQQIEKGRVATSIPHIRKADKGFDGVIVRLDSDGENISAVLVSEDKATPNSRKLVHQEVWREIRELESGQRDNELLSEVTAILERSHNVDVDRLIADIHWKNVRAYRVAVTAREQHKTDKGRAKLFAGFEAVAPGPGARRRAEMLHLDDVRTWMDAFCVSVRSELDQLKGNDSV